METQIVLLNLLFSLVFVLVWLGIFFLLYHFFLKPKSKGLAERIDNRLRHRNNKRRILK